MFVREQKNRVNLIILVLNSKIKYIKKCKRYKKL